MAKTDAYCFNFCAHGRRGDGWVTRMYKSKSHFLQLAIAILLPFNSVVVFVFFRRSTIKTRCKQQEQQQWQRLRHSERINEKPERETKSVHLICHWWFVELITVKPFNKSNADDLKCRRQSVTCLPFVMCVSEWFFSLARLLCSLDCLFCFFLGSSHSF